MLVEESDAGLEGCLADGRSPFSEIFRVLRRIFFCGQADIFSTRFKSGDEAGMRQTWTPTSIMARVLRGVCRKASLSHSTVHGPFRLTGSKDLMALDLGMIVRLLSPTRSRTRIRIKTLHRLHPKPYTCPRREIPGRGAHFGPKT